MSLDQKIAELDAFINNFLKEHFHKADVDSIRPHLINYIKNDKNVIAFSGGTSEEAEFAIKEFIKKACDKYYKQVMAYKETYFNVQDDNLAANKLIDNVLDRFYGSIAFHIQEFLEKNFPNQSTLILKNLLEILANREATKLSLIEDTDIQKHAKLLANYSPYDLEGLILLEEIIEGFAELKLPEILKHDLKTNKELEELPVSELTEIEEKYNKVKDDLLKLSNKTELLITNTNCMQSSKKEAPILNFLQVLWEKLKNLFSKQPPESSQRLYTSNATFFRTTGHYSTTTSLANREDVVALDDSLQGFSRGL